jgi:hypothetical protein
MGVLRRVPVVLLAAGVAAIFVIVVRADAATKVDRCPNQPDVLKTAAGAHKRAAKGWNAKTLRKDKQTIERVRIQARCAPTQEGRRYVREQIERARAHYRKSKVAAYYAKLTAAPGQARLAVLRQCESTNRYNDPAAPAGAYGMLQGWSLALTYWTSKMDRYFGHPSSPPYTATPEQQDILASLLYQHHGTGPWECPF